LDRSQGSCGWDERECSILADIMDRPSWVKERGGEESLSVEPSAVKFRL
jgi:hypothetical protein